MAGSTLGPIANVGAAERPQAGTFGLAANRDYRVLLDVQGDEASINKPVGGGARKIFPIEANLPERFHMELSSQWGLPLAQADASTLAGSIAGPFAGDALQMAAGAAGVGTKSRSQHIQVWESTTPLQINLDLIFYAQENTEREIKERHLALLKLCAPSTAAGGEILVAPGPTIVSNGRSGGRRINLFIGRYLTLTDIIITNVGTDIVTLVDENGIPIAMTINLGVSTWNAAVTGEDLEKMFYGGVAWPSS